MLKQRIEMLERRLNFEPIQKKKIKIWQVPVDPDSREIIDKQSNEKIDEIKSGKVQHLDGSYYSEEDLHMFLIIVCTRSGAKSYKPIQI